MEINEEDEERQEQPLNSEEKKQLEKQVLNDEKIFSKDNMPLIDDNAVYIDYNPQAALQKLITLKDANIYERQTYTKHLAEIVSIIGKDVYPHMPQILNDIVDQSEDILREFLVQIENLIQYFKNLENENGTELIRDLLINPLLQMTKIQDIHIKQNAGKELANIALLLNQMDRQKYILKSVLQNAKDETNEDNRIVAIQQLARIAPCFEPDVCQQFVGLEILSLGDDPQLRVRKEAVIHLVEVSKLVSQSFFLTKLFPFYKKKSGDNNWGIRKSCAETIVGIAELCDEKGKLELQNLMLSFLKDANKWVKITAYKNIGQFVYSQKGLLINEQIFQYYLKMITPPVLSLAMDNEMLILCSYNFPAILQAFGKQKWPQMLEVFKTLFSYKLHKVKKPLACSLHEIAKIIGPQLAWKDLVSVLNDCLVDYSENVRFGSVKILADFLEVFDNKQREKMIDVFQVLQEKQIKWKIRELFAQQIQKLASIYQEDALFQYIVPITLKLCQDTVAQVRQVATKQIYYVISALKDYESGVFLPILMDQIVAFSTAHRFNQRQSFILMSEELIKLPEIFKEHFLPVLEKMTDDKVTGVRILLANMVANHVKQQGQFVENEVFKNIVEKLKNDKSMDVRLKLQQVGFLQGLDIIFKQDGTFNLEQQQQIENNLQNNKNTADTENTIMETA